MAQRGNKSQKSDFLFSQTNNFVIYRWQIQQSPPIITNRSLDPEQEAYKTCCCSISFRGLIEMTDRVQQHSCFALAITIPLSRAFSHAHEYARVSTAVSFFCCHKCHTTSSQAAHLLANNTSLSTKQYVIFYKTTRHFQQNNTLLVRPIDANRPSKNSRTLNDMHNLP